MKNSLEQKAGSSLLVFTFLLAFTMILHPIGGSIDRIIQSTTMIVITHSVAIFAIPFGWIGFYGLTKKLGTDDYFPLLGIAMASLALIAVLLAGATNGIVLPIFLQHYKDADAQTIDSIKPIIKYGFAINNAYDYIYTGTFCAAIFCWSIAMLQTKKLPIWLGWTGIVTAVGILIIFITGTAVNTVTGLRIFGAALVVWLIATGMILRKTDPA